jgi:hypothetical protein
MASESWGKALTVPPRGSERSRFIAPDQQRIPKICAVNGETSHALIRLTQTRQQDDAVSSKTMIIVTNYKKER